MKVVVLIDGGYLRSSAKEAGYAFDNKLVERVANSCVLSDEVLMRIFYYDSPLYRGKVNLPVSGKKTNFSASDKWLLELAKLQRFAVRRGTLGFRGWRPKQTPIPGKPLEDSDFSPVFEQKGVDMRIGLDIATFAERRIVERVILLSGDTDMIPAMKHARKAGLEVSMVQLPHPTYRLHPSILEHCDTVREVNWPDLPPTELSSH